MNRDRLAYLLSGSKNNSSQRPHTRKANKASREGAQMGRLIAELVKLAKNSEPSHANIVRQHEILEALKGYMEPDAFAAMVKRMSGHKNASLTGVSGYSGGKRRESRRGTRRNRH